MKRTSIAIGVLSVLCTACVSNSAVLVNSRGQTTQCVNKGWGWIGAPVAMSAQKKCIEAAKAAGYSEAPAAPAYVPLSERLDCATSNAAAKTDPALADPACKER